MKLCRILTFHKIKMGFIYERAGRNFFSSWYQSLSSALVDTVPSLTFGVKYLDELESMKAMNPIIYYRR